MRRGSITEYRLEVKRQAEADAAARRRGRRAGQEYPTTTWEAVNNDSVDQVYDLEEHILVVTQVNEAYVFYKELLFGRLGSSRRGPWIRREASEVKSKTPTRRAPGTPVPGEIWRAKLIKANSIVWFTVANTMDALVAGGRKDELNAMGVPTR